jgi:hypothetical protein
MTHITAKDIEAARRPSEWDFGNRVLYDLCREHPFHKKKGWIIAKIWLIGRSYSAAIERRRNAEQDGDDFYVTTVAPKIKDSGIDGWIAGLSHLRSPGTPEAIRIHKRLTDLFSSFTGLEKRSLASKYLHFHLPAAFFIYDSRVRGAISKFVPRLNQIPGVIVDEYDPEYRDFVRRCVWLRHHLREFHGISLSTRQIDKLLLAKAT